MKKKDLTELKNKSTKDLALKVKELEKNITESALESKLGKSKNVHETRNKRRELAQTLTFLKQKDAAAIQDSKNELEKKNEKKTSKLKKEEKNDTQ